MTRQATGRQQLQDAFLAFNRMSEQLQVSYRELEQRAADLSAELAAARSERLRQLAEKERLANRLEKLLDVLPGGVVVLDGNGVIQDCNSAARELLGEPLTGEPWDAVTRRAFAPRGDDTHELSLCDGRRVDISRRALGSEPGEILLLHDVTETRALQDALSRQQRLSAMGEMTASLAHQIRTPLATALLYASQLTETTAAKDQQRFADKLLPRLRQLERMVNDMLVFARGGRGGNDPIAIEPLLNDLLHSLEPQLQAAGAVCAVRNDIPDAVLHGNREALLGALGNLLTNAIQACDATPQLELSVFADDGDICIRVRDNGRGIPEQARERLFEPFFTTRAGGTGLGLAVVQAIVRAHGGFIAWSTTTTGSCFELHFPPSAAQGALPSGARTGIEPVCLPGIQ